MQSRHVCVCVDHTLWHRVVSSKHAALKLTPGDRQQHICSSFRPPLYLATPSLRVLGASMMVRAVHPSNQASERKIPAAAEWPVSPSDWASDATAWLNRLAIKVASLPSREDSPC